MTKPSIDEGEIWANRFNVALARSNKVLETWKFSAHLSAAAEDEDDLKGLSETDVIGVVSKDDSDLPESLRQSRASKDKLLEQILGKKGAREQKLARAAGTSKQGVSEQTASAAKARRMRRGEGLKDNAEEEEEEEEEEGGRTSAFSSRKKTRHSRAPASIAADVGANPTPSQPPEEPDDESNKSFLKESVEPITTDEARSQKSGVKRKTGSYLDEILAQKAKKKKKKKTQ